MRKILIIILFCFLVIFVTGCSNNKDMNIENKIESESEFAKTRALIMLKRFEQNEYVENNVFNWARVQADNKVFLESFGIIEADLSYAKLDETKIQNVKDLIQNINNYSTNQNINSLKVEFAKLYIFFDELSKNEEKSVRVPAMQVYMNSILQNDSEINSFIERMKNEYNVIKRDGENFVRTK